MMIHQSAFEGKERLLKGGLHCHTTRSDGAGNPEDTIRLHKQKGFDFLALTDHNYYNYTNFAPDVDIIIVPGMERDHSLSPSGVHMYHTVCIGPARENGNGFEQDQRFKGFVPVSGQEAYQAILDDYHAHNNLTFYCHPEWSATPVHEFDRLEGNFAMEIWNSGCALENHLDTNAAYWDHVLLSGKRIWGVATDDGHTMETHGNGWVNVRAQRNLDSILDALRNGSFYSSCGPEIYDFYVQDGVAVLECSPCESAGFRHAHVPTRLTHAHGAANITHVEFTLLPFMDYVRGVVMDANGRRAWTNPIFLS